ncbi:MAG: polymerase large subunit [Candidatus Diapherotrites archaeon]|nr:polymerase large subunit [Candidatus Diapherotrites archaeon]
MERPDISHIPIGRPEIKAYFDRLLDQAVREWEIAEKARAKGLDPKDEVEVKPAVRMSERAEALLGVPGLAKRYEELFAEIGDKFMTSVRLMEEIADGKLGSFQRLDERLEYALKAALLIYTDAVVVAPIEGITDVQILENADGTKYISVGFAGPIRSAGGTAAALALLLADYLRQRVGLDRWKPSEEEKARWVEETLLYFRVYSRQYRPSKGELEVVYENIPVRPDGEPTEDFEVSAHRDMDGLPNRVRGGLAIAVGESLLLKAKKIAKIAKKLGLDWDWVLEAKKQHKAEEGGSSLAVYLEGLVAGRPVFSYPGRWGGFRVRYGRARNVGVMASGVHPATMVLTGEFIATGTQLKRELPGKAMGAVPVDGIDGPIVLLENGDVVKVESVDQAYALRDKVKKILFLGDVLIAYGDFRKAGEKLVPPGYVEEWWARELERAVGERGHGEEYRKYVNDPFHVDPYTAVRISKELGVPLHPRYIHYYRILSEEDAERIISAVKRAEVRKEDGKIVSAALEPSVKELLEKSGVPHRFRDGRVIIEEPYVYPFLLTFGYFNPSALQDFERAEGDVLSKLSAISGVIIRDKAGTFIGVRMARPEAAKPRKMSPPPHGLFPVGSAGGSQRLINKAAHGAPEVEVAAYYCPKCNRMVPYRRCPFCGGKTIQKRWCPKCGRMAEADEERCHNCGAETKPYMLMKFPVGELLQAAMDNLGMARPPETVKGVIGVTNPTRIPERLEKVLLRAKHDVYVFKDGTIRVDLSNLPLTHFRPFEIGVSVERLRELGYTHDIHGNPLERDDQVVELFPSDVIISEHVADYLVHACQFVDDLLVNFYHLPPYYNVRTREDLVGVLVIGLAPHTSAGILGRIIGFTRAHAQYCHPYYMLARRRNADGDEDAYILLLDALLNFSVEYLPEKRGGKMDAPLVVTVALNPTEVDDEIFEMEYDARYPLKFYEAAVSRKDAAEVDLPIIGKIVGTPDQFREIVYSHETSRFDAGPEHTAYSRLNNMIEKIETQLEVQSKIAAVDNADAAERVLVYHFLKDIMGNARAFGRQEFRCVKCNTKYRRVPLKGVCRKCGGRLVLTVSRGSVEKYLDVSKHVVERYGLTDYTRQRLLILEREIKSVFESEGKEQKTLADFWA